MLILNRNLDYAIENKDEYLLQLLKKSLAKFLKQH